MKLIDCFIFYNELDLLNYRLNVLNDVVDYFVIVESTHTFIGNEKQLYFKDNSAQFEQFNHKIIHVIVDDFPFKQPNIDISKEQQWSNEHFQRNCIERGIKQLELNDEDLIVIADLDEIPDPSTLINLKTFDAKNAMMFRLEMDFYYYNLNSQIINKWYLAKILSFCAFKQFKSCEDVRQHSSEILKKGGWHLSYFGDEQFVKNKIQNFSHQEFNNDHHANIENIKNKIDSATDLFGRGWNILRKMTIKDNAYLPPEYEKYLSKYYAD